VISIACQTLYPTSTLGRVWSIAHTNLILLLQNLEECTKQTCIAYGRVWFVVGWHVSRTTLASDERNRMLQCLWERCVHQAREEAQRHLVLSAYVYITY